MRDKRNTRILWGKQVIMTFLVAAVGLFAPAHAQPVDPLVEEGVNILEEKHEIQHLQQIGKLDATQAQEQLRAAKQRWDRYWQKIPPQKQAAIQAQIKQRNAEVLAGQQQKWAAEASQSQNEASAPPTHVAAHDSTFNLNESPAAGTAGQIMTAEKNSPKPVGNAATANIPAAGDSGPMVIDVVGLRLGMSPAEVEKVFKQRHLDNGILPSHPTNESIPVGKTLRVFTFRDIATGQDIQVKDSKYVSSMRGVHDPGPIPGAQREEIRAEFTPLHNREQLMIVWREQYYSPGNQPAMDTLLKSLKDKYGSYPAKSGCDINGIDCQYIWHYRQDGEQLRDLSEQCVEYGKYVGGTMYRIPDVESNSRKCGSILVRAKPSGRNGLANSVVIVAHNVGLDLSSHKAADAIMQTAEKERADLQMQKARSQKPDF